MNIREEWLGLGSGDHGIAPISIAKVAFKDLPDPQELVGKPFRAGHRSFRIDKVEETDEAVIVTLGREYDV